MHVRGIDDNHSIDVSATGAIDGACIRSLTKGQCFKRFNKWKKKFTLLISTVAKEQSLHLMSPFKIFLLFSTVALTNANQWTNKLCKPAWCDNEAVKHVGNYRAIGNKADNAFLGYSDVWANQAGSYFTADVQVNRGQTWPRIYEGAAWPLTGSRRTPGYPRSVSTYPERWIHYDSHWSARKNGENLPHHVKGKLFNGAYIWLNDRYDGSKWEPYPIPKWPFSVEVNIWNKHDGHGYRPGAHQFVNYHDRNGEYEVRGHHTGHDGDSFYAFYVTLKSGNNWTGGMQINMRKLLNHLRYHTSGVIQGHHEVIEVCVAAEGHPQGDGKFSANIYSMGRPWTCPFWCADNS